MARARNRVIRGRGQRAPTTWGGTVATAEVAVPALTKVLLTTFTPDFTSGETVRRMRGTFLVTAGTSAIAFHGAVGSFVANDTAVAAGVASLLDPVTDAADDAWFWYNSFHGGPLGAGEPGSAGRNAAQVYEFDSKGMRRIDPGFTAVFVVANASAASAFNISLSVRLLGSESS